MKKLDIYITSIFIVKVVFLILTVTHIYLKAKGEDKT